MRDRRHAAAVTTIAMIFAAFGVRCGGGGGIEPTPLVPTESLSASGSASSLPPVSCIDSWHRYATSGRIGNSNALGRGRRGAPRGVRGPSLRVGEWAVLDSVQADPSRRTRAEHARRRALHRGDEVPRLPASGVQGYVVGLLGVHLRSRPGGRGVQKGKSVQTTASEAPPSRATYGLALLDPRVAR